MWAQILVQGNTLEHVLISSECELESLGQEASLFLQLNCQVMQVHKESE